MGKRLIAIKDIQSYHVSKDNQSVGKTWAEISQSRFSLIRSSFEVHLCQIQSRFILLQLLSNVREALKNSLLGNGKFHFLLYSKHLCSLHFFFQLAVSTQQAHKIECRLKNIVKSRPKPNNSISLAYLHRVVSFRGILLIRISFQEFLNQLFHWFKLRWA